MSSISSDILVFDSRSKTGGTNQAATYSLLNMGGIGPGTYELLSYHSLNQMYNVEIGVNDSVLFDEGSGLRTGTMTPGNYTIATMLVEIVDAMDNAPSATQTYGGSSYDAASGKYTFVPSSGNIGFSFGSSPPASAFRLLGMDPATVTPTATVVSVNVLDQLLHTNIFVTLLQEGSKHVTINDGSEFSLMIPLNSVFTEHIHHRKQEHYQQTIEFSTNISTIDIELHTQDGVALVNAPSYQLSLRKLF